MTDIKIVDAVCGSGKTTWIFNEMKSHPERKWLFVSPYLDEVGDGETEGRIQKELPSLNFKTPTSTPTKSQSFMRLAKAGENISTTHKLFTKFKPEVSEVLKRNKYAVFSSITFTPTTPVRSVVIKGCL